MITRALPASHGRRIRSAGAARPRPDGVAVSPAIGPLPAIDVPAHIGGTMPETPVDLRYSKDHLWVRPGPGTGLVRVGVTDFAQQSLGDVVEVTLPRPGNTVNAGEACGDIESVKSVSDLIAPVTGTAAPAMTTSPARRNSSTPTRTARAGCSRPRSTRPR